jgi:hypothetical protein
VVAAEVRVQQGLILQVLSQELVEMVQLLL